MAVGFRCSARCFACMVASIYDDSYELFYRKKGEIIYNSIVEGRRRDEHDVKKRGSYKILFAGRLTKQKNLKMLIDSLGKISNDKRWTLEVCGLGEDESELRGIVQQKGLSRRVLFRGFEVDLRKKMHSSDLFVFPSRYEMMRYVGFHLMMLMNLKTKLSISWITREDSNRMLELEYC